MRNKLKTFTAIAATAAGLTVGACGGHKQDASTAGGEVANPPAYGSAPAAGTPTTGTAPVAQAAPHHGKLKGALIGAAVGHVLGGHAVAGAAAGAMIQHERNKHP